MNSLAQTLDLAMTQQRAGNLREAETLYRQILDADPGHVDALRLLGVTCTQLGRHEQAAEYLQRASRLKPDRPEVHNNLGIVLKKQGKLDEAIACYERALSLRPDYAKAHNNLGVVLLEQGRLEEAEKCLRMAIRLQPNYAEAYTHLGVVLAKGEQLGEAVACCEQAVRLRPKYEAAHNNLGIALRLQGKSEAAIDCHRKVLQLKPDHVEAHCNLGCALMDLWRCDEAAACFHEALRIEPSHAEGYTNLGLLYSRQGKLEQAIDCFRQALRLIPDCALTHTNLGHTLLQKGAWEEGWAEYEWRWKSWEREGRPAPEFDQPRWDGLPLEGRTILLYAEQGLGDVLQFIRYVPLVAERGGRVLIACHASLIEFLAACLSVDGLVPMDASLPAFDVQAPLLSVPLIFHTTPDTVPSKIPYLFAQPGRVERWRQKLAERDVASGRPSFRIGIAWQGNPKNRNDRERSLPLTEFSPLAALPGVRLVNLQVGLGTEQLDPLLDTWPLIDLGALDFPDSAAVMCNLDLVVSIDSAMAHLAGGLGVPVWVALPFAPDFRWFLDREDSPWYPTMRLFRQAEPGQWRGVFERMAAEMSRTVGSLS